MMSRLSRDAPHGEQGPVTVFGPDFPFPFDDWIAHPAGLGSIPAERHGEEVAIVGAGISGLVAAYELMRLGVKPVVYEASQLGGRLRSQAFEGAEGIVAELGGMRFPVSSTSFYHYVDMLGLSTRPFPNPLLDRTRYMQSSKTFVMVDRPFWKDIDPRTGRDVMSMTLTDRLTRGTYLFDHGDGQPGVICLTYSWMSDALKMLPEPVDRRVQLALAALNKIYPDVDIASHIISDPITVSWEADRHFLGAFKGALPGHYRYNQRMYAHFRQDRMPQEQRGIFIAGDDVSWTPAWVEGAVQTSLNAVWGIMHHLGGRTHPGNPGPGDVFANIGPIELPE
jgi:monoamine oxidase